MSNINSGIKEPLRVLTVAEQEALIKEEVQKFIKLAKDKPFFTMEEVNELLPPEFKIGRAHV